MADKPLIDIRDFHSQGIVYKKPKFYFHMAILEDKKYISPYSDAAEDGIGYVVMASGNVKWLPVPIRLTASGHEFHEILNQIELLEILKKEFKETSIDTLFKAGKQFIANYTTEKIGKYINES